MATKRQVAANRANAEKSAGPRTPEGKSRSRRNALKHGLTANHLILLQNEDPDEFVSFHDKVSAQLAPKTELGALEVDRLVGLLWRMRRVPALEAGLINNAMTRLETDSMKMIIRSMARQEFEQNAAEAFEASLGGSIALRHLLQLEGLLSRQIDKSLERFERFERLKVAEVKVIDMPITDSSAT